MSQAQPQVRHYDASVELLDSAPVTFDVVVTLTQNMVRVEVFDAGDLPGPAGLRIRDQCAVHEEPRVSSDDAAATKHALATLSLRLGAATDALLQVEMGLPR